jgi:hypothetical protein
MTIVPKRLGGLPVAATESAAVGGRGAGRLICSPASRCTPVIRDADGGVSGAMTSDATAVSCKGRIHNLCSIISSAELAERRQRRRHLQGG